MKNGPSGFFCHTGVGAEQCKLPNRQRYGFTASRFSKTSHLMRPYMVRHLKSQDHGCRCSLKLTATAHHYMRNCFHAPTVHVKIQQKLITLINICALNCNTDSAYQLFQSSPLALSSTETQISLSSDITDLQFPNYIFRPFLFPKQVAVL